MRWFERRSLLLLLLCVLLSCSGGKPEGVRMALPDDLCGILGYTAVETGKLDRTVIAEKVLPLMDCCSTTAEWAMSSDRIDIVWLCPDAARNLVEKNNQFRNLGMALVNSQILVIRKGLKPKRIAYSHKREYQKALILRRFGTGCEAIPVMPQALPYLFEKGSVDGVVIDVIKGLALNGAHLPLSDKGDVVTYELVVRKTFLGSPQFPPLLAALQGAAADLNSVGVLGKALEKYKGIKPDDARQALSLGLRFVPPKIK
jgi:hypothetical protein